jgi:hypothetical protein
LAVQEQLGFCLCTYIASFVAAFNFALV